MDRWMENEWFFAFEKKDKKLQFYEEILFCFKKIDLLIVK